MSTTATAETEIAELPPGPSLAQMGLNKLPAGYYAMPNYKTRKIHFFQVSHGNPRGKWSGYVFVSELHGDNRERIRDRDQRNQILNAIARNPTQCMALYGKEIGRCGVCGRQLTSEWRLKGIGPECFKNFGK
jgi:hypothetical protein